MTSYMTEPNENFLARLNGEVAFRILLSKKPKPFESQSSPTILPQEQGSAMPHSRRPDDEYIPQRPKSGINFYDMGQIFNGTDYDEVDSETSVTFDSMTGPVAIPVTADFDSRDAILFAIPTGTWTSKFRKITKGTLSGKYLIDAAFGAFSDVLDSLSQWTTKGLVVSQADLDTGLFIGSDPTRDYFFDPVRLLDGEANRKITGTPVYTDSAVAFSPVPNMDVFLPPKFVRLFGNATTSVFSEVQEYGILLLTFPRRFIINTADTYIVPFGTIDAGKLTTIGNWKSIVPGHDYHFDPGTSLWDTTGTFPPTGVNHIELAPIGPDGRASDNMVNGALIAVVKKGTDFYYFWTDGY